ncbi:phosphoribosyltransferase family protein [Porphyromonadaceae bacterium W3.11]|nr:phosphoribosyltransferase family protein [Porphyromonadaceae bacterium W3.11]
MNKIQINGLTFVPYMNEEEIRPAITKIAEEIKRDLGNKNPLFICILNGAYMFASDLSKALNDSYEIAFAKYSSYSGLESTGELKEVMKPQVSVEGRTVVILEDLVDSGFTVTEVEKLYLERGANEVYVAAMLSKPNAIQEGARKADYTGINIPNDFIVGRGLDYNGVGRMLRDIYVLEDSGEKA